MPDIQSEKTVFTSTLQIQSDGVADGANGVDIRQRNREAERNGVEHSAEVARGCR